MKRSLWILPVIVLSFMLIAGCAPSNAAWEPSPGAGQDALVLTTEELAAYNGKDGMPAYIAVDGVLYDVSNVLQWANGEHNGFSAGKDLTREIMEISPHGVSRLNGIPVVGSLLSAGRKSFSPYILLGWINLSLFAIVTSHLWLRFLNKHLFHSEKARFKNFIKTLRQIHKPLGIVLVGLAFIHGFLALGTIRPHTGLLAAAVLAAAAALGAAYFFSKKKALFALHRWVVAAIACLIVIHLVFPNALSILFGI